MYDFRTDSTGDEVGYQEARFADLLNAYRVENGLSAARFSVELSAAGNRHAQDAELNGYNGHAFSDGTDSGDFYNAEFLAPYGYDAYHGSAFWGAWENALTWVTSSSLSAERALSLWQASAPHNAAMLDPVVTEFGIGMTASKAFLVFGTGVTTTFSGPVTTAGTSSAETIAGTSYADQVTAAAGDDMVTGAAGTDVLYGNAGDDVLYGNTDADTVYGGQDADRLFGGQGADVLYGNLGDDVLYGNLAVDVMYGGQGSDTLYGGQGDDILYGNAGDDLLLGNLGADRYEFGGGGADTIQGFDGAGGDRLALDALGYTIGADASGTAVISFTGGSVTLVGVAAGDVEAGWFV
jgi:Ca2+-binding RTX toxin-like protein